MSVTMSMKVSDHATPAILAKMDKCAPSRLRAIVAPALVRHVQSHLVKNGTNKRGWPSTHFWADAARGTSWSPVDSGGKNVSIAININKIGVRQRFYGGTIEPVKAKALAIPISPVSYGHVPADFPGLFMIKTPKGAYLCQRGDAIEDLGQRGQVKRFRTRAAFAGGNAKRRLRADLNLLFKLVGSVTQAPDPSVIPSSAELGKVAIERIEEAVK